MSSTSPEVVIAVAILALLGSLVASYVAFRNARERKALERDLVKLRAEFDLSNAQQLRVTQTVHEEKLAKLRSELDAVNAAELRVAQEKHDLRLKDLEQQHAKELAAFDARIQAYLTAEKVREVLNEANWKRVIDQIRVLKNTGHSLLSALKSICIHGHEVGDQQVLDDTQTIVRLHREFREQMKPLFGEIRSEDYERLNQFHRYQTGILLDIARTQEERRSRIEKMRSHLSHLEQEERFIEAMAGHFLRPTLKPRPRDDA